MPPPARPHLTIVKGVRASAPAEESDEELVAGVRAGHAQAKERIYLRHVEYIAGMCVRLLRSVDASEDVVQDTFVIAFAEIDTLREPAAFRGWLASIAARRVYRHLSRQRWLRLFGLDGRIEETPLDELAREDFSAEARSELAALDLILQQLPPGQRLAWMLRYVEGEPLETVATACSCSLATAKRWIAAADAKVRTHVSIRAEVEP